MASIWSSLWDYFYPLTAPYEPVDDTWAWIPSVAEEAETRQLETARTDIQNELRDLQHTSKMIRCRNLLRRQAQTLILKLTVSDRELLHTTHLPMDTLVALHRTFLVRAAETMAGCDQRTILSMMTSASLITMTQGLHERELADIIWAIFIAVKTRLTADGETMTNVGMVKCVECLLPLLADYLALYLQTVKQAHASLTRMGQLPAQWLAEAPHKLPAEGAVDCMLQSSFADCRKLLASTLVFPAK